LNGFYRLIEAAENPRQWMARALAWLDQIDPGVNRRVKGLRLVTAYGIAALLGTLGDIQHGLPSGASLSALAGGFALWGSVFEAQTTRAKSARDLALFGAAAVFGAFFYIVLAPVLSGPHRPGPELAMVPGAFLVGYLRRYGVLGAGIGSQLFMGELLSSFAKLQPEDLPMVVVAGIIAAIASIVPRLLSGPAEQPIATTGVPASPGWTSVEMIMGMQAAVAAAVITGLSAVFNLVESVWAITACTYVIANSTEMTLRRIRHRVVGTAVGVPLGIALITIAPHAAIFIWVLAAFAIVIYAMALPERYDIACGAYAFTLIITLAVSGDNSIFFLASRLWETLIGGVLGLAIALYVVPQRQAHRG
jgi:hypothetical protein